MFTNRVFFLIAICDVFFVYGEPNAIRHKRQVLGGKTEKDVNDPKFKKLAEESMAKYLLDKSITDEHQVTKILKATTQVVAGLSTELDFLIEPKKCKEKCGKALKCHSIIWEKAWENFKQITVTCENVKERTKRGDGIPGGETEVDATDPKYKVLAEESLNTYAENSGSQVPLYVVRVTRVVRQIVAGSLIKIDFDAVGHFLEITCHSEVLLQPWLNKKEITVNCGPKSRR